MFYSGQDHEAYWILQNRFQSMTLVVVEADVLQWLLTSEVLWSSQSVGQMVLAFI